MNQTNQTEQDSGKLGQVEDRRLTATIVQPNGDLTNREGRRILDAFEYRHLKTWVDNQFGHRPDEHDETFDSILTFLANQDDDDRQYWTNRGWWEVLEVAKATGGA